jgi:hypothetical protein
MILHELALPDGRRILADVSPRSGIRVARFDAESRELARCQLDYPLAGFGGGGWVLSPSGKLLVLHYYSGQSEETFALLDLSHGAVRLVANPRYEFGEYASYAFSPEEGKMIMALPRACVEWWAPWEDDCDGYGTLMREGASERSSVTRPHGNWIDSSEPAESRGARSGLYSPL